MTKKKTSTSKANATSKRGGRRDGAGRKRTQTAQTTRELEIAVDEQIGVMVPTLLANLFRLANGGYERVTVTQEYDPATKMMIVTKRVVEIADADRAANEYLLNRRLGKPRQALELSGPDGSPIPVSIEAAIELIYGEEEPSASALTAAGFSGEL